MNTRERTLEEMTVDLAAVCQAMVIEVELLARRASILDQAELNLRQREAHGPEVVDSISACRP